MINYDKVLECRTSINLETLIQYFSYIKNGAYIPCTPFELQQAVPEMQKLVNLEFQSDDQWISTAQKVLQAKIADLCGYARDLSVVTDPVSVSWAIEYLWSNI